MPAQVLVVDQNPLVQATIENTLNSQNCAVTSVRDALSGLDLAYKIKPDLMIADLRMEGLMVYSFCARVKQKSFLSHIPIFLLVQQNDVYDETRLRQSGVVGFIQKPVDPAKLNEVLNSFLIRFSVGGPASAPSPSFPGPPASKPEAASSPASEPIDAKGDEFNMSQTADDKTMTEMKTAQSFIKAEETIKMDDLMDWAQPEVSPFSEVISTPLPADSSEVTQLADVTQLTGETKSASPFSSDDFSEVTQLADVTRYTGETDEKTLMSDFSYLKEGKPESDFLQETAQEPFIEEIKEPEQTAFKETVIEIKEQTQTSSVNGKLPVSEIPPALKPVSVPLSKESLEISDAAREIIEKVAWEVVPHLTEQAIKKDFIAAMIEKIIWEVLPPIAEQSVNAAIRKITEEQESSSN